MANKFARKKYYDVATVDGLEQLDYLSFKWINFKKFLEGREVTQLKVTQDLEGRLDLVSADFYKDVFLWWIIALANDILDPVNDLTMGMSIIIPKTSDIEAFFQAIVSKRQQKGEVLLPRLTV